MFQIPLHALIVMVGPLGAGKSTFVNKHFKPYEVISSDGIREELTGDFQNQHVNEVVFQEFYHRIETKLLLGERAVADATNLRKKDRAKVAAIGVKLRVPIYYIVMNRPLDDKLADGDCRDEKQISKTEETFKGQERDILSGDGTATVIDIRTTKEDGAEDIEVVEKLDYTNLRVSIIDAGYDGIDIIGDVHGMTSDFQRLVNEAFQKKYFVVQLGDLVDYGPDAVGCVDIMYRLVIHGRGLFIIGNHERKLERYLKQKKEGNIRIQIKGGIVSTIDQLDSLSPQELEQFERRFATLMYHARHHAVLELPGGPGEKMMFVHAACSERMWDRVTSRLTGFEENRAVFGQIDKNAPRREDGFPNRIYDWVNDIPKGDTVYVGHDIQDMVRPHMKTNEDGNSGKAVFVDTGSGKGGVLSVISRKITP